VRAGLLLFIALAAASGCGSKKTAIAELTKADGPVDRQQGDAEWRPAKVGTEFYIGDAARTADGAAGLQVTGGAQIAMQPHTILRFGGKEGNSKIAVELGAIDLTGTGSYGLEIGDVKLSKGTVRITAKGKGQSTFELTIGDAQVSTIGGQTIDLVVGKVIDLGIDEVSVKSVPDAGVADAPVVGDAAVDAGVVASGEPTIEVTGTKAEIQAPGDTAWKSLPAGSGPLAKGTKLRLGAGTTAKMTARGLTLELAGGTRAAIDENLIFAIEVGSARASVPINTEGKISVPGGAVAVKGTAQAPAEAKLDVNGRETKVTMLRGGAKLTGANGGELDMNRGESATLAKAGTIRVIEAIPTFYDFKVAVGETLTIHDPKGVTAVQFSFGGKCPDGGIIEMDRDARFRTAKVSAGKDAANMSVAGGGWAYRLRCSSGSGDSAAVASGRIAVTRDAGSRALPKLHAVNEIDADGRNYRISYQSVIPTIAVRTKNGIGFKLHFASGGKEETFDGAAGKILVQGTKLHEGTYTYWLDRDGVKDPKVTTLTIDFDNTAPQVYIESPQNGKPWEGDLDVRGAVLPGWTAAVDAISIPIDKQRRFAAKVGKPTAGALAIRLSHPQRGVHYYLRRPK
jgi:hypothetical protein